MAYNEKLTARIREALAHLQKSRREKNVQGRYIYGEQ